MQHKLLTRFPASSNLLRGRKISEFRSKALKECSYTAGSIVFKIIQSYSMQEVQNSGGNKCRN